MVSVEPTAVTSQKCAFWSAVAHQWLYHKRRFVLSGDEVLAPGKPLVKHSSGFNFMHTEPNRAVSSEPFLMIYIAGIRSHLFYTSFSKLKTNIFWKGSADKQAFRETKIFFLLHNCIALGFLRPGIMSRKEGMCSPGLMLKVLWRELRLMQVTVLVTACIWEKSCMAQRGYSGPDPPRGTLWSW